MWLIQIISCKANNCSSLFGCYQEIFKLNSSHDALATRDINRTKIVFYKFGIHDFGIAYINRGIIMKKRVLRKKSDKNRVSK